ncbi:hypothetical protein VOI54_06090 [Tamlana sp. 2201CG12-4]|uniref:hypothetical protein n=1 Tax=Tamlana sp. 2201CG12-4 TaxID=3112582 RepID=UPI002DBA712B|nr:hypothetical protein [Tamlana sp. 2201CG12-4]MEC3906580.1 hypothetical protein [Tamlana sp. 2201CG12-4]
MKPALFLICFTFLWSCSKNSDDNRNCNFLLDVGVNFPVDLNLPQYSQLAFAGNSIYIPNIGNGGVIVASTGANFYAWDAGDPNHALSPCSVIVPNGLFGTCGCDDKNKYNFITGRPDGNDALPCSLKNYRIEKNGNTLLIFN